MDESVNRSPEEQFYFTIIRQPELGSLIREARKEKKISMAKLGAQMGVSGQTVATWECGARTPKPSNAVNLARALGKPDNFFFRQEEKLCAEATMFSPCEHLRSQRAKLNISQTELASRTGISLNKIKAYEDENSGCFMTESDLKRLMDFFEVVRREDLLGLSSTVEEMENKLRELYYAQIDKAVRVLNNTGLGEAVKRITELSELSRYCR